MQLQVPVAMHQAKRIKHLFRKRFLIKCRWFQWPPEVSSWVFFQSFLPAKKRGFFTIHFLSKPHFSTMAEPSQSKHFFLWKCKTLQLILPAWKRSAHWAEKPSAFPAEKTVMGEADVLSGGKTRWWDEGRRDLKRKRRKACMCTSEDFRDPSTHSRARVCTHNCVWK